MTVVEQVSAMQEMALRLRRKGTRIGLVPTMGFLHAGHASLMKVARSRAEVVVVSLFVNPTQFGPAEDFQNYPRDLDRDRKLCGGENVDVLFCPAAGDMYPRGYSVHVEETELSAGLCGASRPGHFRGVATVVTKLFHIVQPDVAVFGQKDAQQCRVIQQLVRDLNFSVEIVVVPTVREADGLAMSTRNAYLSASERQDALCLVQSLRRASQLYREGVRDGARIRQAILDVVSRVPRAAVDYVEIVDADTLRPVSAVGNSTLIALAVKIGRTRLIDNLRLGSNV